MKPRTMQDYMGVLESYDAGMSWVEICRVHKIAKKTAKTWYTRALIYKLTGNENPVSETGKAFNPRVWTENEDDLLREKIAQGYSHGEISARHLPHRSKNAIQGRVNRLGLQSQCSGLAAPYQSQYGKQLEPMDWQAMAEDGSARLLLAIKRYAINHPDHLTAQYILKHMETAENGVQV